MQVINVKIPDDMKKALEKLADKELSSLSVLVRKALDEFLTNQSIHWRQQKPK
jgi:predicted transcriptional regulator